MAPRQEGQLDTPSVEEGVIADEEGVGSLVYNSREGRIYLTASGSIEDLDLQPHGARGRFDFPQRGLRRVRIRRINEHGNASRSGHKHTQEFQSLLGQLDNKKVDPCQVAARPGEAGHKTELNRVFADDESDWDRCGGRLGRKRHSDASARGDYRDLSANQFGSQHREPIELILGPAVYDRHVLALDVAGVLQALAESCETARHRT